MKGKGKYGKGKGKYRSGKAWPKRNMLSTSTSLHHEAPSLLGPDMPIFTAHSDDPLPAEASMTFDMKAHTSSSTSSNVDPWMKAPLGSVLPSPQHVQVESSSSSVHVVPLPRRTSNHAEPSSVKRETCSLHLGWCVDVVMLSYVTLVLRTKVIF